MPDLTSRLRDIVRSSPRPAARELTYEPEPGYEAGLDLDRVCDVLSAKRIETDAGVCLVIERRYEAERWHGRVQVGTCVVEDDDRLHVLDGVLAPARAAGPILFVDLETTGLSGGAGTVAFLVGCGWFDGGAFHVRQFLLPSFAAERALLAAAADLVGSAALVVTYNGKTFDMPLMETRWLFHRLETPFADKRHFDMLHPARRLWRKRAAAALGALPEDEGCSLGALERVLLDVRRQGDVPGWEIPSRYFQFLRTGDARPLEAVLEHNRLDLVSLAAVVARGQQLVAGGAGACRDAHEMLALGRMYDRAAQGPDADECFCRASEEGETAIRAEALLRLAWRRRRERRYAEAAQVCRDILVLKGDATVVAVARRYALESLAIHHEHRERDLEAARNLALAALDADERPRWRDGVRYRLQRLERKLASEREKGGQAAAPWLDDDMPGE